jgi:hypothetical protein
MRYPAKFVVSIFARWDVPSGRGVIHIEETGIILDAFFPKLRIPVFLWTWFRIVLCGRSVRTIPYSTIVRYRPPKWLRRYHEIRYRLPSGKERSVLFSISRRTGVSGADFSARIAEGRAVAGTYLQS